MRQAHLFVGVLAASSYTYGEATGDEQLANWIGANVRAFEFYQGVPKLVVPDNTKTGVTKACRYEPGLNPTYQIRAAERASKLLNLAEAGSHRRQQGKSNQETSSEKTHENCTRRFSCQRG